MRLKTTMGAVVNVDDEYGKQLLSSGQNYTRVSGGKSASDDAADSAATDEEVNEDDLDSLTVAQLKEIARRDGVDITGLSKKAELIEALSE